MPIPFLASDDDDTPFPDVSTALIEPNGLLMAGGSLAPTRLVRAYRRGVFPWFEDGEPILWWSPDPRCVIWPDDIKVSRSLRRTIRSGRFEITENLAFREVMKQCGAPRAGSTGTWVTTGMIDAYCRLNALGIARSLEVWEGHRLVGGPVRHRAGAGVRRRIDVLARERRLQGGAGCTWRVAGATA